MFIVDNQLMLLILCFLAGSAVTALMFRNPPDHRVWLAADLVWVLLGGLGAGGAILAELYAEDSGRIARQIDLAYAATTEFDRDAARFRLAHCEGARQGPVVVLCDKVDFLSASTASNADLPLFIALTGKVAPLQGLHLFATGGGPPDEMTEMRAAADRFDPAPFLVFTSQDDATRDALQALRGTAPALAAEYKVLADSYDGLVSRVGRLKQEWEVLQANAYILTLQVIAICLVGFAAPFRLGKSLVALLHSG
jgi:hypothetical protein